MKKVPLEGVILDNEEFYIRRMRYVDSNDYYLIVNYKTHGGGQRKFIRKNEPSNIIRFFYDVEVKSFPAKGNRVITRKWDNYGNEMWILSSQCQDGQNRNQYYILKDVVDKNLSNLFNKLSDIHDEFKKIF